MIPHFAALTSSVAVDDPSGGSTASNAVFINGKKCANFFTDSSSSTPSNGRVNRLRSRELIHAQSFSAAAVSDHMPYGRFGFASSEDEPSRVSSPPRVTRSSRKSPILAASRRTSSCSSALSGSMRAHTEMSPSMSK